ncbi:unnamed protein product [Bathycoccus prasinos]
MIFTSCRKCSSYGTPLEQLPPPKPTSVECNIEIAHATVNLVESRFLYHKDIEGEAVLQVHDDVQVAEKTVDALYEQWKRTAEAIVGVESEGRTFEADGTYRFDSYAVGPCAIVVGKTFMMHRRFIAEIGKATNNSRRLETRWNKVQVAAIFIFLRS